MADVLTSELRRERRGLLAITAALATIALVGAAWATIAVSGTVATSGLDAIAALEAAELASQIEARIMEPDADVLGLVEELRSSLSILGERGHVAAGGMAGDVIRTAVNGDVPGVVAAADALRLEAAAIVAAADDDLTAAGSLASVALPVLAFVAVFAIPALVVIMHRLSTRRRARRGRDQLEAVLAQPLKQPETDLPVEQPEPRSSDLDDIGRALGAINDHLRVLSFEGMNDPVYAEAALESIKPG